MNEEYQLDTSGSLIGQDIWDSGPGPSKPLAMKVSDCTQRHHHQQHQPHHQEQYHQHEQPQQHDQLGLHEQPHQQQQRDNKMDRDLRNWLIKEGVDHEPISTLEINGFTGQRTFRLLAHKDLLSMNIQPLGQQKLLMDLVLQLRTGRGRNIPSEKYPGHHSPQLEFPSLTPSISEPSVNTAAPTTPSSEMGPFIPHPQEKTKKAGRVCIRFQSSECTKLYDTCAFRHVCSLCGVDSHGLIDHNEHQSNLNA
jgi:hypothetical protein